MQIMEILEDQCNNSHIPPSDDHSIKNSDVIKPEANKDFVDNPSPPPPSLPSSPEPSPLGPITPDSYKETSSDIISNFTSPFSHNSHSHCIHDMTTPTTPCTPKQAVFDPFAPGPDKLMLAPHCTKYLEESRSYVVRRLNFPSSSNVDGDSKCAIDDAVSDEDTLLETVYDTLLKAIISKQTEEILSEISSSSPPPSPDGFKTPTSVPRLNGIAETCPGAPLKPIRKLRNIELGLCRKLEF